MAITLLLFVVAAVGGATWMAGSLDVSLSTLPYAIVGTVIIWQRPRTSIGWVLLLFAGLWSATFFGLELTASVETGAVVVWAAWLSEWTWFPALVAVFVVLPILFPTGRPSGRGWAGVLWFVLATCVAFVVATTFQAEFNPTDSMTVDNPWALLAVADVEVWLVPAAMPLLLMGPVAAVVRFRRSVGVERQQIRWFTYAAVACGVLFAVNAAVDALTAGPSLIVETLLITGLSLPPIGIWVAITRHHLYDIDRLISRTVSYGLLTALLVGLYVLSVFVLGAIIPVEGELPVAGATLLVAAVFAPLRRRIQDLVDRQFNRARYNARRLVEDFSHHLREEHDLEGIAGELGGAVVFTMQPSSYALWLADGFSSPAKTASPGEK